MMLVLLLSLLMTMLLLLTTTTPPLLFVNGFSSSSLSSSSPSSSSLLHYHHHHHHHHHKQQQNHHRRPYYFGGSGVASTTTATTTIQRPSSSSSSLWLLEPNKISSSVSFSSYYYESLSATSTTSTTTSKTTLTTTRMMNEKSMIRKRRRRNHYFQVSSSLSSSNNDDDNVINDTTIIISGRQKRLSIGYQTISLMYGLVGIFHILKKGIKFWSLYYAFGGPFLACGVASILQSTTSNNYLLSSQKTYKRLNLCLLIYGLLGISLPIIDPNHFTTLSFIIPPLVTTINSIKGYGYYGVLGIDYNYKNTTKNVLGLIVDDLKEQIKSTIQGLFDFQSKSFDYILALMFVTGLTIFKFKECISLLIAGGSASSNPLMLASRISRLARLSLLTGVIYTLKIDGADQNQLSKSTFVILNYLISSVFLTMAGYLCPTNNKPTFLLGCTAFLFSFIFGFNGYTKSQTAKKKLKQE